MRLAHAGMFSECQVLFYIMFFYWTVEDDLLCVCLGRSLPGNIFFRRRKHHFNQNQFAVMETVGQEKLSLMMESV